MLQIATDIDTILTEGTFKHSGVQTDFSHDKFIFFVKGRFQEDK